MPAPRGKHHCLFQKFTKKKTYSFNAFYLHTESVCLSILYRELASGGLKPAEEFLFQLIARAIYYSWLQITGLPSGHYHIYLQVHAFL